MSGQDEYLKSAFESATHAGHWLTAIEVARTGAKLCPRNPFWGYRLGENLRRIGRRDEAEAILTAAYGRMGEHRFWVEISLGQLFATRGRFLEAESWLRRATHTAPFDTAPWVCLGGYLAGRERFEEAIAVLERGLHALGDVDEVYLNLALNKRALGNVGAARACCERALELDPEYADARHFMEDIARLEQVCAVFGTVAPQDGELRAAIRSAVDADHWLTAIEIARTGARIFPDNPFWGYWLGDSLRTIGRRGEAEATLTAVYERMGEDRYWVEISLGQLFEARGRFAEAEGWLRRATHTAPFQTAAWVGLCGYLMGRERFEEAIAVLETALQALGDVDELYFNLALNKRALGDVGAARACCERALQLDPEYPLARQFMEDIARLEQVRAEFGAVANGQP